MLLYCTCLYYTTLSMKSHPTFLSTLHLSHLLLITYPHPHPHNIISTKHRTTTHHTMIPYHSPSSHHTTPHYTTPHYTTPHHITSHHITSHHTTLHHIPSHYITLYFRRIRSLLSTIELKDVDRTKVTSELENRYEHKLAEQMDRYDLLVITFNA